MLAGILLGKTCLDRIIIWLTKSSYLFWCVGPLCKQGISLDAEEGSENAPMRLRYGALRWSGCGSVLLVSDGHV